MQTIQVELGDRSYPIFIGSGLLDRLDLVTSHIKGQQVMVVSNETVAPIYLDKVCAGLSGFQCESVILPDGERYKTLEVLLKIFDALLEKHFGRDVTIIALGGGVVGDMAGFAAACHQRGVDFIQVPTTLLAQVDSSVGGKTGVNHPLGKNMIGAFHQPQCVLIDTDVLNTLDNRQLSAGLAEVVKYGLIRDGEFYAWLETNMESLLDCDPDALSYAIARSCQNKAEIVAADERESGVRALLNLGHTFGHAIETGMGYGEWLHGEAVAAGMHQAADLSQRLGWISSDDVTRIALLLESARLPVFAPRSISTDRFLELMAVDKKVKSGRIRLVLLKSIGEAVIMEDFDNELLRQTLEHTRQ